MAGGLSAVAGANLDEPITRPGMMEMRAGGGGLERLSRDDTHDYGCPEDYDEVRLYPGGTYYHGAHLLRLRCTLAWPHHDGCFEDYDDVGVVPDVMPTTVRCIRGAGPTQ